MKRLIASLLAATCVLTACALTPSQQAQQRREDRALICNSLVYYAPPLEAAEMALAVAEYGERECDMPGLTKEMERWMCSAWKKQNKITDAECAEWINELRNPVPLGYFDGAENVEDVTL